MLMVGVNHPESVATLPPFGPIEGQKWFDRISSQWESHKNRFALIYFGKIRFLPPCIWNIPFVSYSLCLEEASIHILVAGWFFVSRLPLRHKIVLDECRQYDSVVFSAKGQRKNTARGHSFRSFRQILAHTTRYQVLLMEYPRLARGGAFSIPRQNVSKPLREFPKTMHSVDFPKPRGLYFKNERHLWL